MPSVPLVGTYRASWVGTGLLRVVEYPSPSSEHGILFVNMQYTF